MGNGDMARSNPASSNVLANSPQITGVVRGSKAKSNTSESSATAKIGTTTEDKLPVGAIDPVALKARTQANLAQYFNAVLAPAAPATTTPPPNQALMAALGSLGSLGSLASLFTGGDKKKEEDSNRTNRQDDVAQNTSGNGKKRIDDKANNSSDPNASKKDEASSQPEKKVGQTIMFGAEDIA